MNAQNVLRVRILGLLLLAVLGMIGVTRLSPRAPSVQLNDGSILRLEHVTYLRPGSFLTRLPWFVTSRRWVTQKLGRPNFYDYPFVSEPSLIFWISRRDPTTGSYMQFDWLSHTVAVDSHGCEFSSTPTMTVHTPTYYAGGRPIPRAPPGSKFILASGVLPVFPRRDRFFTLRVYDQALSVRAEFKVPNPVYRRYPTRFPETIPATHALGQSNATLTGFTVSPSHAFFESLGLKQFRLTPELRLPPDWELSEVDVEDATGNRGSLLDLTSQFFLSHTHRLHGNNRPISTDFSLCPRENAWLLRATVFRAPHVDFTTNETWTISHLAIPDPGTARVLTSSHTWLSTTVKLCSIVGPGSVTYSNGVPVNVGAYAGGSGSSSGQLVNGLLVSNVSVSTDKPQLMIQIDGLPKECRFQAVARVDGSAYLCSDSSSCNDYQLLQFEIPPKTLAVDLTFIIQKPRHLSFLIHPEVPRPN